MSSTAKLKTDRDRVLEKASDVVGTGWAEECFDELWRQRRPVAGGWPGTVSEARGRTRAHLDRVLARSEMRLLTHEELTRVSRAVYESARRLWLSRRVRGPDE